MADADAVAAAAITAVLEPEPAEPAGPAAAAPSAAEPLSEAVARDIAAAAAAIRDATFLLVAVRALLAPL